MERLKPKGAEVSPRSSVPLIVRIALFAAVFVSYAWFFQGGGWNQNSRFDVVRALVESRTFEITEMSGNTGDVAEIEGRVYSNKPPGLAVLLAPAYAGIRVVQRALDLDPASPRSQRVSAHLLSVVVGALPGAALALLLLMYLAPYTGARPSFHLALAFAFGTLVWPYAGLVMNHVFVAFGLFAGWMVLDHGCSTSGRVLGGLALGAAVMSEYLVAPLLAVYAYMWWRESNVGSLAHRLSFWVGPTLGVLGLLGLNAVVFGGPFQLSYDSQSDLFQDESLWMGMFGLPDVRRVFWLSVHPFRGLLWACPVLILPLLSLIPRRTGPAGPARWAVSPSRTGAVAIMAYFGLFYLTFNGWSGGWAVGPRYLIPTLPFLWIFAPTAWERFRRTRRVAVALSVALMLAVTSTLVMSPAPSLGPPPAGRDPVMEAVVFLARGEMSVNAQGVDEYFPGPPEGQSASKWDSYNIGEALGLVGWASLLPLLLLTVLPIVWADRRLRKGEPDHQIGARAGDPGWGNL